MRFNDAVDPSSLASKFFFVDKQGNKVATEVVQGRYQDLSSSRALGPTWRESFQGWARPDTTKIAPETLIASAVAVVGALLVRLAVRTLLALMSRSTVPYDNCNVARSRSR